MAFPVSPDPPVGSTANPDPPVVAQHHTEAEEAYLEGLYAELEPQAKAAYVSFFLARTPPHLQEDMKDLVEAGLQPPDPPSENPPAEE